MTIEIEEVELQGLGGASLRGWLAQPAGPGPHLAVVVAHEVFGRDAHMRALCQRLAAEGFVALVPDLYRGVEPGPPSTAADPAPTWSLDTIRAAVAGLPDRQVVGDLDAAVAYLEARADVEAGAVGCVGFCAGGSYSMLLGCTSRRVGALVSFYGRPLHRELTRAKPTHPLELMLNLDRPLLAFFGGQDAGIPADDVERLRELLTSSAKSFEIVTYPEAGHGFFNDMRCAYHEPSATDAERRMLAFLRDSLA